MKSQSLSYVGIIKSNAERIVKIEGITAAQVMSIHAASKICEVAGDLESAILEDQMVASRLLIALERMIESNCSNPQTCGEPSCRIAREAIAAARLP